MALRKPLRAAAKVVPAFDAQAFLSSAGVIRVVPKISQDTLADIVGTTRSRVNFFLNKFKKLGFIDYDGELPITINSSLLSVVLHD